MFLFSFKGLRAVFSAALILLAAASFLFELLRPGAPAQGEGAVLSAAGEVTAEEISMCRDFLQGKGWALSDAAPEVGELAIPERFHAVFSAYNELQKLQGFDLAPFEGRTVKKVVFALASYPGAPPEENVRATLLLYGGRIVGGDISSVRPDGFMHGFSFEKTKNEFYPT